MKTQPTTRLRSHRTNPSSLTRIAAFVALIALIGIPLFSSSSASSANKTSRVNTGDSLSLQPPVHQAFIPGAALSAAGMFPLMMPQAVPVETVAIYQSDCTTADVDFTLGQTVCVKLTNAPLGSRPTQIQRRLAVVGPGGYIRSQVDVAATTTTATLEFTIPATATSVVGGDTIDNRGTWQGISISTRDGTTKAEASFSVTDSNPDVKAADLSILKIVSSQGALAPNGNVTFTLFVANGGPNDATDVEIRDSIPANTTFVSESHSDPGFTCTNPLAGAGPSDGPEGRTSCTATTFAKGGQIQLTLTFLVDSGTALGTEILNTADISSATTETSSSDNISQAAATVTAAESAEECELTCPVNKVVTANTTQAGQPGAFVTYSAASGFGNCGTITNNPPSGSFFTVGTHTITSTSAAGPSCTFTVKVVDTPPPTISCPGDRTATAGMDGTATVDPGMPTFTASGGGTTHGVRSDSTPAVLDDDGNEITPAIEKPLTDPYPTGITGITWTVTDADGRTASCVQRIIVNAVCSVDTEAPTITPPANLTVSTGPDNTGCTVALDDELGQATATDDCSVTITVSGIPPGNEFPLGTTTLTYTATDPAGHTATGTQTVTIIDNTPPRIAAPPDATYVCPSEVPAASPSQATRGIVLDEDGNPLPPGPPFDNCGVPTVTVSETSSGAGSAASPRIILRTFTAMDSHGNSASAVQTITVIDATPPTITAPANASYQCASEVPAANASQASASDNCAAPTVGVSETNNGGIGSAASPLIFTRTFTATDAAGNSASAIQTITVIDVTPPTITCAADIIADFNPAVNGAVVTYTTPVGSDNCNGASTAQTGGLPSGATFPTGTTTNTFTVTDHAGLTATCSFKVTVALTSIIGLNSVTITGAGYADSYSSAGGYPATKGSLANILSNGTITMGNSAKVWGNVRSTRAGVNMTGASQVTGNATAGTTVTTSGSATVGGTRTNNALAPVMTLPAVVACGPPYSPNSGITGTYSYNASTGDLTLSGVNIATLANGNYCFHNVTLGNSAQLKVNGPVVIKLTGTLNTSGATNLNNTTQIPSNLRILSSYSGSNGMILGNSASVYALIYAPNTGVNISGAAPLFGTAAGKTLTIGNSGAIHYDTQLKTIWPAVWTLIFGP